MPRAATLTRGARLFWASLVFHLKGLAQSSFFLVIGVITPVVLATIAFYLFQSGGQSESLLCAALGAGLMGIWSTTLFGSGGAIQWQRWQGTLELLIAAPTPFVCVLLPLTLAAPAIRTSSLRRTPFS